MVISNPIDSTLSESLLQGNNIFNARVVKYVLYGLSYSQSLSFIQIGH